MAHVLHEIHSDIHFRPAKAKARILAALKGAGMHRNNAAKTLGCSYNTFLRWIAMLGLRLTIEQMTKQAKKEGWFSEGRTGRPSGSTIANGVQPRRVKST